MANTLRKKGYGVGRFFRKSRFGSVFEHSGGSRGVSVFTRIYPELDISIVVLSNTDKHNAQLIVNDIESILLPSVISSHFTDRDSNNISHKKPLKK